MRSLLLSLVLLLTCVPAMALAPTTKPLIADLSQYHVEIDSRFTGANLLLFGARNDTGDIVIVVRGPDRNFTVRKKERVAGMWINTKQITFKQVPSYYNITASRPFGEIRDIALFSPLRIGENSLLSIASPEKNLKFLPEFQEAFLDYQRGRRLYSGEMSEISFVEDTLFKTSISFPDNIPRGTYTAEAYLVNGEQLVSMQSIPIRIYKQGFDAFVYDLAHNYPLLYGILAVVIALGAGWAASEVFRKV